MTENQVGRYRKILGVNVPSLKPPASSTRPGDVTLRGAGWKISIPVIALTAVASAVGARMLPTPTQSDRSLDKIDMQLQVRELRDEQWRSEIQRDLKTIRERLSQQEERTSNTYLVLEERLKRIERALESK